MKRENKVEKAFRLLRQGKVKFDDERKRNIYFTVRGDNDNYIVKYDKEREVWSCLCDYFSIKMGDCSHILACRIAKGDEVKMVDYDIKDRSHRESDHLKAIYEIIDELISMGHSPRILTINTKDVVRNIFADGRTLFVRYREFKGFPLWLNCHLIEEARKSPDSILVIKRPQDILVIPCRDIKLRGRRKKLIKFKNYECWQFQFFANEFKNFYDYFPNKKVNILPRTRDTNLADDFTDYSRRDI